jgi:hypothetical protein
MARGGPDLSSILRQEKSMENELKRIEAERNKIIQRLNRLRVAKRDALLWLANGAADKNV